MYSRYRLQIRSVFLLCFISLPLLLSAGEIGINVYGLSYHPNRKDSRGKALNELNPGLGLNYIIYEKPRNIFQFDAGIFKNSGRETAKYIGAAYRYKFGRGFSGGGEFVYFHSSTYNNGDATFGVFPMASYRRNPFSFTLLYLPRYKNINRNTAFGLYGTIHLGKIK